MVKFNRVRERVRLGTECKKLKKENARFGLAKKRKEPKKGQHASRN